MTKEPLVFKELRNDFLRNTVGESVNRGVVGIAEATGLPYTTGDQAVRIRLSDQPLKSSIELFCGPCYGQMDTEGGWWSPDWDRAVAYLPPNRADSCAQARNYPDTPRVLDARRHYSLYNFFHTDSPWSEVVGSCFPEMFEGYDTPEERADLVAKIGWVVGPTAFATLTKTQLGAFMVYSRRQNEFVCVRETFKHVLEHERTRDLPLAWNMFFAHHHMMSPKTGKLNTSVTSYSHNCFYPDVYPLTALAFVTQKVIPVGEKETTTWRATGGRGTWQQHNCDRMWQEILHQDPKYAKVRYEPTPDYKPMNNSWFRMNPNSPKFNNDIIHQNVSLFEEKVARFVK